ncbi:hypothetical protein CPB86DRAFT_304328 [Serendipita vermifera]|nr:hypothetical protein CPB86DRAFT_304328 [Serendipita vermifera]
MQLQLIPPAPHPTVLFSFTLPDLQSALPLPIAYATQLQLLLTTEVDHPPSPYALDKAAWGVYLMEMVTYDFTPAKSRVEVRMIDGSIIRWDMQGEEQMLARVMIDVEASKNEAERERRDELRLATAASTSSLYLPLTNAASLSMLDNNASRPQSHRRSKSLFNSLLSAFNFNYSTNESGSFPYSIGGGSGGNRLTKRRSMPPGPITGPFLTEQDFHCFATSEFTFPLRAQLPSRAFPPSKALRRRARSTLVDCYRRWVIPRVKERIRWGMFIVDEEQGNGIWEEEQLDRVPKLKKISRSTNSYAEWACRSMISRCEYALQEEQKLISQIPGNMCGSPEAFMEGQTQSQHQEGMPSEKESRRSSASSTFTSAISASSRASSSHEQIEGDITDVPFDTEGLSQPLLSATLRAPRPNTLPSVAQPSQSNPSAAASLRRISTLRTAVDRFRSLHDTLVEEALGLMDSHSAAMRILEERGRRRGWSSTESGLSSSSKLSATKTWSRSGPTTNPAPPSPLLSSSPTYGTGASVWELSIPLVRSSLGEISSTWEDWQMEWEMERDFGCEDSESFDMGAFPDIISEFGNEERPSMDGLDPSSRSSFTMGDGEEHMLDHSGFSDSDSSEDESGVDPSTSGEGAAASTSGAPRRKKSTRGHRAGAQARLGTYEDVRDELPPSPPLLSLSPPPKATKPREGAGRGTRSPTSLRPPRGTRPSRLHSSTGHRRDGATYNPSNAFAQSRLDDLEAGVFDSWDEEEEANAIFSGDSYVENSVFHSDDSQGDEDERIRQLCDGLGILEQVGGTSQTTKKTANVGFNDNVGIGFPPGLHSDMPPPPLSPTKKLLHLQQESQRRPSFYIPRDEPDLEAGLLAANQPIVSEKSANSGSKAARRPKLRLSFSGSNSPTTTDQTVPPVPPLPSSAPPSTSTFNIATQKASPSQNVKNDTCAKARDTVLSSAVTTFEAGQQGDGTASDTPPEAQKKDTEALLLDTPTTEYSSSTYPYKWELNVVPNGVVVVGTVGVVDGEPSKDSTVFPSGEKPATTSKRSNPILCVTPPAPSSSSSGTVSSLKSISPRTRTNVLRRAKSWRERSANDLSEMAELVQQRHIKTDASIPPVPVIPSSGSRSPTWSPGSATTPSSSSTPSLSSSPTSSTMSSYFESVSPTTPTNEGVEGPTTTDDSTAEAGVEAWFPHHRARTTSTTSTSSDITILTSGDHGDSLFPPSTSPHYVKTSSLSRAKSMTKLKEPPPPPRPKKSLKRSLSLHALVRCVVDTEEDDKMMAVPPLEGSNAS